MPRKKIPPMSVATESLSEGEVRALRKKIAAAVAGRADNAIRKLNPDVRGSLVDDLVRAVRYAKIGLPNTVAGSRAKRSAWGMDIFVRDVCHALQRAGLPVLMNPDPQASLAQSLAREIARVAGLPDQGDLFHQMQRARKIETPPGCLTERGNTCCKSQLSPEGRLRP